MFRFAPLQGDTAALRLSAADRGALPEDGSSSQNRGPGWIILDDNGVLYRKSNAVLRIWCSLGGDFRIYAFVARLVPRVVRDRIYDLVAANRYRIVGRSDLCYLPSDDELARFLP
jgi:predicted DCC family thiol-disulfide oxidoreductase YuxK